MKFNARIPTVIAEELRDCVVALYSTNGLTIDALTAMALEHELERLKKEHNAGRNFRRRAHDPKPGRPLL